MLVELNVFQQHFCMHIYRINIYTPELNTRSQEEVVSCLFWLKRKKGTCCKKIWNKDINR